MPFHARLSFSNTITGDAPTEPKEADRLAVDPAVALLSAHVAHHMPADAPRQSVQGGPPWLHLVLAADTSWSMGALIRNPSNPASAYKYELNADGTPTVVEKDGVRRTILLSGPEGDISQSGTLLAFYKALLERAPAGIACSLLGFDATAHFLVRRGTTADCLPALDSLTFEGGRTKFGPLLDRIDELLVTDDAHAVVLATDGVWTDDRAHQAVTERLRAMTSAHPGKLRLLTLGINLEANQPLLQEYAQATGSQTHELITTFDDAIDTSTTAKAFVDDLPLAVPEAHQVSVDLPGWATIWKIMTVRARGKNQTLMVYSPAAQDFTKLLSEIPNGGVRLEESVSLAPGETQTYHIALSGSGAATEPRDFYVRIDGEIVDSDLVLVDSTRREEIRAAKPSLTTIASVNIYQLLADLTAWLRRADAQSCKAFKASLDQLRMKFKRFDDVNDRGFKRSSDALDNVGADITLREAKGQAWTPKEYVAFLRKLTRTSTLVPTVITRARTSPSWRCLNERCLLSQGEVPLRNLVSTGVSPFGPRKGQTPPKNQVPVGMPLFVVDINAKREAEWRCALCEVEQRDGERGVVCLQPDSVSAWDIATDPWMEIYDLTSTGDAKAFLDGYVRGRLSRPQRLQPRKILQPPMNTSLVVDKRFFQQDIEEFRDMPGLDSVRPPVFVERRAGTAGVRIRLAAPFYRLFRLFDSGAGACVEEHAGGIFRVRHLDTLVLSGVIMLRFVENHQE